MEKFEQKLKYGTNRIRYIECENPKDDCLTYKSSNDKTPGEKEIIRGKNAIRRFREWLNRLDA